MDGGLLLVHAHPDDETIMTGATMAHYARRGVPVTLVTCTLGEEGEILVPELRGLEAAQADQLGGYRIAELAAAMRALGVRDHRFLGGAGRFRDSGMLGSPANDHPRAFWRAAKDDAVFAEAVAELVAVIREVRPEVVVTYDENGGYGHPDHVMAHRVTTAAVAAAGARGDDDRWQVGRVYVTADPYSALRADVEAVAEAGTPFTADLAQLTFGVLDRDVTTYVDASDLVDAKRAALQAHRTQIDVVDGFYALSNGLGRRIVGVEYFRHWTGIRPARGDDMELEAGLFLGGRG